MTTCLTSTVLHSQHRPSKNKKFMPLLHLCLPDLQNVSWACVNSELHSDGNSGKCNATLAKLIQYKSTTGINMR